jgi:hypothetical protein
MSLNHSTVLVETLPKIAEFGNVIPAADPLNAIEIQAKNRS